MDKMRKILMFCLLLAGICSPVFSGEWRAHVVKTLDALVSSCVVVPCSFTHPGGNLPSSRLRGIWHRRDKWDEIIYDEDKTKILDNYKDRTQMLGHLGQNNCTLEIVDVRDHDNGPFCFRIELVRTEDNKPTKDKFSFVEECVEFNMLPDAPAPTLNHPPTAIEGQPYTVTCSIIHTCPSHWPKLSWTGRIGEIREDHKDIRYGNWETQSILTFVPEEKDDHGEITCTAEFFGQKTSSKSFSLYVKRAQSYNHIIIPTVVAIGTAVIFGILCILMAKKYNMWNRLSRLSRRQEKPDSDTFFSLTHITTNTLIFYRRPRGDMVDFGHTPNNATCGADQKASKPRFPSPKSQPKSYNYKEDLDDGDDYVNTADLNVYGNI
uniref:Myelin-associated glycoprotein-like n=1 Tax=Acanthochromis polyacanthus TaxID=80966 RepID=A0A3Q1ESE1_9TELE